jgi:hypothetical protein
MPSEAFDRQEVVILMGEDLTGHKHKFLPIIRQTHGPNPLKLRLSCLPAGLLSAVMTGQTRLALSPLTSTGV